MNWRSVVGAPEEVSMVVQSLSAACCAAGSLRDEGYAVAECDGLLLVGDEESPRWYVLRRTGGAVEVVAYCGDRDGVVRAREVLACGCSEASAVREVLAHDRGV